MVPSKTSPLPLYAKVETSKVSSKLLLRLYVLRSRKVRIVQKQVCKGSCYLGRGDHWHIVSQQNHVKTYELADVDNVKFEREKFSYIKIYTKMFSEL